MDSTKILIDCIEQFAGAVDTANDEKNRYYSRMREVEKGAEQMVLNLAEAREILADLVKAVENKEDADPKFIDHLINRSKAALKKP